MKKLLAAALLFGLGLCAMAPAMAQVNAPIPSLQTALSNTAVQLKGAPGVLQWGSCYNPNASIAYVQVFDATSVTVGTTTPTEALPVPATTVASLPFPAQFFNAIKVAATTTATGGTAPGSALVCNFGFN